MNSFQNKIGIGSRIDAVGIDGDIRGLGVALGREGQIASLIV
jgi:hypothetical protein